MVYNGINIKIKNKNEDLFFYSPKSKIMPQKDFSLNDFALININNLKIKEFDSSDEQDYYNNKLREILEKMEITIDLIDILGSLSDKQRKQLILLLIDLMIPIEDESND